MRNRISPVYHLVPLELGGSPASPRNLWPEPHHVAGGWGSYRKDRLENRLNHLVCRGRITLAVARHAIARISTSEAMSSACSSR